MAAPEASPPTRGRLPHVGALDGLRAVSLVAVLCYHGGFDWAKGGFLGVSTFFTLSGFLITSLLLMERHTTGTVSLRRFWTARARRLLPAALVTLVLVVLFAVFAATPSQLTGLRGDLWSCFLLATNWRLALSGEAYGAYLAAASPVQHIWSLAVEEQFYLFLPLLVLGVTKWTPRPRRALVLIASFLGLASTASVMLSVGDDGDTTWAYYATHNRAAELLAGVVLACTVHHLARWKHRGPIVAVGGMVGAALLVTAWVVTAQTDAWLYQGGLALYALGSSLVVVACLQRGPVRTALGWAPLQWVGRISYGAYLYHWPLFLWLTEERVGVGGVALFAVRVAVTIGFAWVSAQLLEQPIRARKLVPRMAPAPAAGLLVAALALVLVVPAQSVDTGPSGVEVAAGERVGAASGPTVTPVTTAVPGPGPTTEPAAPTLRTLLIVGDSITRQVAPYVAERFPEVDVRWVGEDGIGLLTDQGKIQGIAARAIAEVDPDVVLVHFAGSYLERREGDPFVLPDGTEVPDNTESMFQAWDQQSRELLATLGSRGAEVLWASVPPIDPDGFFGYLADSVSRFNQIYAALPDVQPVDWYRATLGDGPGGFVEDLTNAAGQRDAARSPDGLHFTAFGYRLLVDVAAPAIEAFDGRDDGDATPAPGP